jgi:hypothetical protein
MNVQVLNSFINERMTSQLKNKKNIIIGLIKLTRFIDYKNVLWKRASLARVKTSGR